MLKMMLRMRWLCGGLTLLLLYGCGRSIPSLRYGEVLRVGALPPDLPPGLEVSVRDNVLLLRNSAVTPVYFLPPGLDRSGPVSARAGGTSVIMLANGAAYQVRRGQWVRLEALEYPAYHVRSWFDIAYPPDQKPSAPAPRQVLLHFADDKAVYSVPLIFAWYAQPGVMPEPAIDRLAAPDA